MLYNVVVKITKKEIRESLNSGKEYKVFEDVETGDIERHLMIIEKSPYMDLVRIFRKDETL